MTLSSTSRTGRGLLGMYIFAVLEALRVGHWKLCRKNVEVNLEEGCSRHANADTVLFLIIVRRNQNLNRLVLRLWRSVEVETGTAGKPPVGLGLSSGTGLDLHGPPLPENESIYILRSTDNTYE